MFTFRLHKHVYFSSLPFVLCVPLRFRFVSTNSSMKVTFSYGIFLNSGLPQEYLRPSHQTVYRQDDVHETIQGHSKTTRKKTYESKKSIKTGEKSDGCLKWADGDLICPFLHQYFVPFLTSCLRINKSWYVHERLMEWYADQLNIRSVSFEASLPEFTWFVFFLRWPVPNKNRTLTLSRSGSFNHSDI